MAITNPKVTFGWMGKQKCSHVLPYKKFCLYDDADGNNHISVMRDIQKIAAEVNDIISPHGFRVDDVYTEEYNDTKNYGKVFSVAIGFNCIEDLVMAKLLLKCDSFP